MKNFTYTKHNKKNSTRNPERCCKIKTTKNSTRKLENRKMCVLQKRHRKVEKVLFHEREAFFTTQKKKEVRAVGARAIYSFYCEI